MLFVNFMLQGTVICQCLWFSDLLNPETLGFLLFTEEIASLVELFHFKSSG